MLVGCPGAPAYAQALFVRRAEVPRYPDLALAAGLVATIQVTVTVKLKPGQHVLAEQPVGLLQDVLRSAYFRPSFLPAASSASDSRMRRSRVLGRLAIWIQTTKLRRSLGGSF